MVWKRRKRKKAPPEEVPSTHCWRDELHEILTVMFWGVADTSPHSALANTA
jgi:hypothetical protein